MFFHIRSYRNLNLVCLHTALVKLNTERPCNVQVCKIKKHKLKEKKHKNLPSVADNLKP